MSRRPHHRRFQEDALSDIEFQFPVVYRIDEGKAKREIPVLCARVIRKPFAVVVSVCFPVFVIGMLSMAAFFLGYNDEGLRMRGITLSTLGLAAFKSSLSSKLPEKTYLTLADRYIVASFLFYFVLAVKVVVAFQSLSGRGVGFFSFDGLDEQDDDGGGGETRRFRERAQVADDITSW